MLPTQLQIQPILKLAKSDILAAARYGDGGGLVLRGVDLDLVFEGVVVEVVQAPLRNGLVFQLLAVFHAGRRRSRCVNVGNSETEARASPRGAPVAGPIERPTVLGRLA